MTARAEKRALAIRMLMRSSAYLSAVQLAWQHAAAWLPQISKGSQFAEYFRLAPRA